MTGHPIRRPDRWQVERAERQDRDHREAVAAELADRPLPPPVTEAQVVAFTGAAEVYVQSAGEAMAHALVTRTAARYYSRAGLLIVAVDAAGLVVERGLGRWP